MAHPIDIAVNAALAQVPQSFEVASHWSDTCNAGAIIINRQTPHDKYAVWYVTASGERCDGFYTDNFSDASTIYNAKFMKLTR